MLIALYIRHIEDDSRHQIDRLVGILNKNGIDTDIVTDSLPDRPYDFLFSIGGDGTLLSSVHLIKVSPASTFVVDDEDLQDKVLSLVLVARDNLDTLAADLLAQRYTLEPRTLLHVEAHHNADTLATFALNEVSLHRFDDAPLLRTDLFVGDDFVANYAGDGLIVATPTGSTAYSLSCGGPILTPDSGCFVITPIGVHNLTLRPIIVPDTALLRLVTHPSPQQFSLGMDSRRKHLPYGAEIRLSREDFKVRLVRLGNQSFFTAIHQKLGWGV